MVQGNEVLGRPVADLALHDQPPEGDLEFLLDAQEPGCLVGGPSQTRDPAGIDQPLPTGASAAHNKTQTAPRTA